MFLALSGCTSETDQHERQSNRGIKTTHRYGTQAVDESYPWQPSGGSYLLFQPVPPCLVILRARIKISAIWQRQCQSAKSGFLAMTISSVMQLEE